MGGKKKKTAVPIKKESKYKIPARFDCPLCDAKNSIAVRLVRSSGSARLHCRSCRAGAGKEFPFLPLEKPVDVFFRFREELMRQDRDFLEEHQIDTNTTTAKTGLVQFVPKGAARTTAVTGAAPTSRSEDVAAMHRIELEEEEEDEENGLQFFAPEEASAEYGEDVEGGIAL
ncbi:transcription elongation factor 1 [Trypanosoma cruzi]|uniref:Transcription elongation factor 1 homolog n=2 Tax=Trypanosoma cruzi TaxID=5693 RepID=Q4D0K5_TRYCC|nr:hypothetical protein, conserved [Trypanosoma cruzi]EAN86055.1 hypothetical protein, conserved [Trypanosoma cruzi]KAF8277078.1 transcription elongation factor 1-like [Trypanosoma cruzi]PWV10925.1 transcription elongation factor 1 [Trypanosoma cruzi]RNC55959.1 hypothetical protein TcCL_ESM06517 [Trypanosoma cruzi]|eukprot:XP_807906.1 hypothetical protein [Trypanosoma cruzi strain CL Brener]